MNEKAAYMALQGCSLVRCVGSTVRLAIYMIMLPSRRLECHFVWGTLVSSDVRMNPTVWLDYVPVAWDEIDYEGIEWELIYKLTGEA